MENLFQATLEGVMESARAVQLLRIGGTDQELPDIAAALPVDTKDRLARMGLLPVRRGDLFGVQNGFFSHKGFMPQTLRDLTRLGLVNYGFLSQAASFLSRPGGGRHFQADGINILFVGQVPVGLIQALEQQVGERVAGKPINLFGQGGYRLPLTLAVADHGSPELALGMNVDALIVAPNAAWPGIEALAAKYSVPVILADGGKSYTQIASEALHQADRHSQTAYYGISAPTIRPGSADGTSGLPTGQDVKRALQAGRITGVVVLFGEANAKQTFFERTLALMEAAVLEKALVLLGGDLGSQAEALGRELARRRGAQFTAFVADLAKDGLRPIVSFGSTFELPAVVSLLTSLAPGGGAGALPAVVAFPEFFRAATWTSAVSLLSLGFTVQIGIRLPFWGSPWLADVMKTEWQKITGGTLLASPALPEARAQAEELVGCLRSGRAR
jgi:hypothetical protein